MYKLDEQLYFHYTSRTIYRQLLYVLIRVPYPAE